MFFCGKLCENIWAAPIGRQSSVARDEGQERFSYPVSRAYKCLCISYFFKIFNFIGFSVIYLSLSEIPYMGSPEAIWAGACLLFLAGKKVFLCLLSLLLYLPLSVPALACTVCLPTSISLCFTWSTYLGCCTFCELLLGLWLGICEGWTLMQSFYNGQAYHTWWRLGLFMTHLHC